MPWRSAPGMPPCIANWACIATPVATWTARSRPSSPRPVCCPTMPGCGPRWADCTWSAGTGSAQPKLSRDRCRSSRATPHSATWGPCATARASMPRRQSCTGRPRRWTRGISGSGATSAMRRPRPAGTAPARPPVPMDAPRTWPASTWRSSPAMPRPSRCWAGTRPTSAEATRRAGRWAPPRRWRGQRTVRHLPVRGPGRRGGDRPGDHHPLSAPRAARTGAKLRRCCGQGPCSASAARWAGLE